MTPETISDSKQRNVVLLAAHEQVTITWTRYAQGERGPDLHVHHEHTEAFYVLEGDVMFELGAAAEQTTVGPGTFVAVPPYVPHSFTAVSDEDARWLNFHAPERGFADFLRSLREGSPIEWDSFDVPEDGGRPASDALIAGPGMGEPLRTGRRELLIKCDLDDLCIVEWELDGPFTGPPLHHHALNIDAFYVLEGELEVEVGGEERTAGEGELVAVPLGVDHTFNHRRDDPARVLNIHAPASDFADTLRRMAD
jgi:mannose-6-phosphate isomerase-like protein (cupin superfamily)